MTKYYNSLFYSKPIEVENIDWEILVIITDNFWRETIYSWYDIVEKNTESIYINKCLLWGFIKQIPKDVLIIWFWGWTFAKYLEDHIENINITWIDIDKAMVDIAKNELKVKTNDFYILDAKNTINILKEKKKKYDLILIDVYWSDWKIPEYFVKKWFFGEIKNILSENWVLSINFSNYDLEISEYKKIHSNLISIYWQYFSHILAWENDLGAAWPYRWNIVWIYNLNKFYEASDYDSNYLKKFKTWEIIYDWNIIKNTFLDNKKDKN